MTAPAVERPDTEATEPRHTGGMVALIPADHYLEQLTVPGGDPPEQLHLTLAYLGEDVTTWSDEQRKPISSRQPVLPSLKWLMPSSTNRSCHTSPLAMEWNPASLTYTGPIVFDRLRIRVG